MLNRFQFILLCMIFFLILLHNNIYLKTFLYLPALYWAIGAFFLYTQLQVYARINRIERHIPAVGLSAFARLPSCITKTLLTSRENFFPEIFGTFLGELVIKLQVWINYISLSTIKLEMAAVIMTKRILFWINSLPWATSLCFVHWIQPGKVGRLKTNCTPRRETSAALAKIWSPKSIWN